jgi:hypothetical protein
MTAVVIINIVFAAFVLVGIVSLLGRAVVADRRATRPLFEPSRAVRPRFNAPSARSGQRLNPAA